METLEDPSGVPIEQLCLTVRWYAALKRNGVHTVGQLAALPEPRLIAMGNPLRATMDELKDKVGPLGLAPWDASAPAENQISRTAAGGRPGSGRLGRLSSRALNVAGVLLLPARERARWVEEWKGELCALGSRRARVRFIASLLLAGGRELAVTLWRARSAGRR
jgi:hypothetical protein